MIVLFHFFFKWINPDFNVSFVPSKHLSTPVLENLSSVSFIR